MPRELTLGVRLNTRVPEADQHRQRREAEEILQRLRKQPGVILADEVGMGKTYVALAVAYSVAIRSQVGPVLIMVPPNLIEKWEQDFRAFCELYLDDVTPVCCHDATPAERRRPGALRFGRARHSVDLLKLLDDRRPIRAHIIFLAQGAMSRNQTDEWVRLALIRATFRRHCRRDRLRRIRKQVHRFIGKLLYAKGTQRASDLGEGIWETLLRTDTRRWKKVYNDTVEREDRHLDDDPVPQAVRRAIGRVDLTGFADALAEMPARASKNIVERIRWAREALRDVERDVWKDILAKARWRSPLLVMDEAHHLKNPRTSLARQLQSPDSNADLRTGDGALARAFSRMLFLTATPFQLGHRELVHVLHRLGDVRWDDEAFGSKDEFHTMLHGLEDSLTESQRSAIALQRCWSRLTAEDLPQEESLDSWWARLYSASRDTLSQRQRALVEAFAAAEEWRRKANEQLRGWVIRHNKGRTWSDTGILRRKRLDGAGLVNEDAQGGVDVPRMQLLPFFLAARSAIRPGSDLLGEALCSSYEAFRFTRRENRRAVDDLEDDAVGDDLSHSDWYLRQFDRALRSQSGSVHPKIAATVNKAMDLWSAGEKVLIFAFYRHTCRALRRHIAQAIQGQIIKLAQHRLRGTGLRAEEADVWRLVASVQSRYFDRTDAPGRRALDEELGAILRQYAGALKEAEVDEPGREELTDIMRRFLRVPTTLVRSFRIEELDVLEPRLAVQDMLQSKDNSGLTWRGKFDTFLDFLLRQCTAAEREAYTEAAGRLQTGGIRVQTDEGDDDSRTDTVTVLANVQVATGDTARDARSRLMRAFNTPFFPDILVCSQVMGEGVDLHRFCRHVIHHDLAWNPSSIEQRTGRVDRLGCKAEGRQPIYVYLPYLSGTADERQYRVMRDREQWFRIVMGQDEVAELVPKDATDSTHLLPTGFGERLSFDLGLSGTV